LNLSAQSQLPQGISRYFSAKHVELRHLKEKHKQIVLFDSHIRHSPFAPGSIPIRLKRLRDNIRTFDDPITNRRKSGGAAAAFPLDVSLQGYRLGAQRLQQRDPVEIKMAPASASHTTSSSSSSSFSRLQKIAKQMAPLSTTSFPAEAVPQAPEDPLFGLMRAFKADESPNKVDLV